MTSFPAQRLAEGFSSVIVNGQVVFDGKAMTTARPGKVLRRN
jgi:hypothetical protein